MTAAISMIFLVIGGFQECEQHPQPATERPRLVLPNKDSAVRFAVIGDTGTGGEPQAQLAETLFRYREPFPFKFAFMLGDNLYGGEDPVGYAKKFERPYRKLPDAGVKFYATLG